MPRGDPDYAPWLDGDGDGIACESRKPADPTVTLHAHVGKIRRGHRRPVDRRCRAGRRRTRRRHVHRCTRRAGHPVHQP
ncbi:excalibur calcium-binding domain-containing protein [Mycolicibacterium insubricum]|uniref:excalibur calcium-binding domain-containing protein n=1 Tax=Mycolicibacterium insubricum TaxID=444597 RepID=UPI0021F37D9F|nr:excalibur calcium-binding domain-containing protein [Mycolicibacterium insubricum]